MAAHKHATRLVAIVSAATDFVASCGEATNRSATLMSIVVTAVAGTMIAAVGAARKVAQRS